MGPIREIVGAISVKTMRWTSERRSRGNEDESDVQSGSWTLRLEKHRTRGLGPVQSKESHRGDRQRVGKPKCCWKGDHEGEEEGWTHGNASWCDVDRQMEAAEGRRRGW